MNWKPWLTALILTVLSACADTGKTPATTMRLYSPPYLDLLPGQVIHTPAGDYTPQTAERWWSSAERKRWIQNLIAKP